jgi:hypothetical protein
MEEKPIRWNIIYVALMASLAVMIALFYWLTVSFA